MTAHQWPQEAAQAVEDALADYGIGLGATYAEVVPAVLAALTPDAVPADRLRALAYDWHGDGLTTTARTRRACAVTLRTLIPKEPRP